MLSLLSLIIASGTVLRADTEQWEPNTYPDPRTNAAKCNTVEHSTLCDPDRILTDTWRQTINDNIAKQTQRLLNVDVQYTEEAKENCTMGNVTDVRIFVILARRINTTSNQNITSKDLTTFGHDLREAFGLDAQPCKNYILILGVELAKELYVWTGSDLVFPKDRMNTSLSQYKNMFLERNYMEGLNKIVEEVGNILVDPFKDSSTIASIKNATTDYNQEVAPNTTTSTGHSGSVPVWIYVIMIISILIALLSLAFLVLLLWKRCGFNEMFQWHGHGKGQDPNYTSSEDNLKREGGAESINKFKTNEAGEVISEEGNTGSSGSSLTSPTSNRRRCSVSEISLPRTVSLTGSSRLAYLQSIDSYRHRKGDTRLETSESAGSFV